MNSLSTGLLSPAEEAALARVASGRPMLAFDFDGTLAPIVADPDDACVPQSTATLLSSLAARCRVAVVTGRQMADVRPRLGFHPWRIVGSHGAECSTQPALADQLARSLDALRARLTMDGDALSAAGVVIEDKQQSIAFHYRQAVDPAAAIAAVQASMAGLDDIHVFPGKHVVNVVSAAAPDKAQAVMALFAQSGAGTLLYAGDDVNDEPVFLAAPTDWLTIQVGHVPATKARMIVDSPDALATLLRGLLELLP